MALDMDTKVDTLEKRLRAKIESETGFGDVSTQAMYIEKLFRQFDRDRSGYICYEEFAAAMVRLNFVGIQREVEALFNRFDSDGSGVVSYGEFAGALYGLVPRLDDDAEARSAIGRLRKLLIKLGGLNGIRTMTRIVRNFDSSGDGLVDREELRYGLKDFGITLSDKDINSIFDVLDVSRDGRISADEFLRGLRGGMSAKRRALIMQAFDVLDKDHSGVVSIEDVKSAYDTSAHPDVVRGAKTADQVLTEFINSFERGNVDGKLTKEEFLDYYKDIAGAIDDDAYFELMIRNAWHMSGGEGASACTSTRRVLVTHYNGSQEVVEVKNDMGINRRDVQAYKRALIAAGVKDIKTISLSD